jgi:POT family proton-dependent oligopeptide transporter
MTSIVSEMYKEHPQKKDAAYTIFYMGVNSGAFLGILLCGYLGEKISWSYGFGLAGIFMLLGSLQFWFARGIFENIGTKISKEFKSNHEDSDIKYNIFTLKDKILMYYSAFAGVIYVINDPLQKVLNFKGLNFHFFNFQFDVINVLVVSGLITFIYLLFSRILRYDKVLKERMFSIVFFAIFTIIFWMAFEQAGGSMTIFAKDYTNRIMKGDFAKIYFVINALITVVPVAIITFVVYLLVRKTYKKYLVSSLFLISSFIIIWSIVFWMLQRDFNSKTYILSYQDQTEVNQASAMKTTQINEPISFYLNQEIRIMDIDQKGKFLYVDTIKYNKIVNKEKDLNVKTKFLTAKVVEIKNNEIEIPATWFLILNSLFIISFAPLFSKWWESRFNPDGAVKYALGLIFLGIGFGMLAFGSLSVPKGATMASLSMIWLILAYLFHTLGELCLSPVALSYISKLVPSRMIAMMFGIWYVAVAIGNKLAGLLGGQIDKITAQFDLSTFFMIFTIIPICIGFIAILLNPLIKKWMHGVK